MGSLFVFVRDVKLLYQLAILGGFVGAAVLWVFPQRRMALVVGWVLVYPLSVEKVIQVAESPYNNFIPFTIVISGADIILLVLAVWLWIESRLKDRKVMKRWPYAATPYAILVGWVIVAFFMNGPSMSGVFQVIHWVKMLFSIIILSSAIRTRNEFLVVLATLALAVFLQSLVVGVAYTTKRQIGVQGTSTEVLGFSSGESSRHRASGTLGHANQQAAFQMFFALPLLGLLASRNILWRIAVAVVLVASVAALVLTFSRGVWLACMVGSLFIIMVSTFKGKMSRGGWIVLCGVCMIGAIGLAFASGPIIDRLTRGDDGASASRMRMVMMSFRNLLQSPITGTGPGKFIDAQLDREPLNWREGMWAEAGQNMPYMEMSSIEFSSANAKDGTVLYVPLQVHNKFLLIMSDLGLVGLGLYFWYQWRVFWTAWYCLRTQDSVLWWSAMGLTGAAVGSQISGMVDLFYDDKSVMLVLFF